MVIKKLDKKIQSLQKKTLVLIGEDNEFLRQLLVSILNKEGFKTIEAKNGKEAWEIYKKHSNDISIVILDWLMPEMDGLEVVKMIRKTQKAHYTYTIFISSIEDREKISECLEMGVDDYIIKPIHAKELLARIKVGLRIIALERLLYKTNKKLEKLTVTDELTNVLNRRGLFNELKKKAFFCHRYNKHFYIIMVDIDHFKKINDRYGHKIGDEVLKEVAQRLKNQIRDYDIIGRYGGEEFLIAVDNPIVAKRLWQVIREKPFVIEGNTISVTISIGVSIFEPPSKKGEVEKTLTQAINTADKALYEAKLKGRDKIIYLF